MSARRTGVALLVVLVVVVTALAVVLMRRPPPVPSAAQAPLTLRAPARRTLVVVGASYTAGLGASSPQRGYAHLVGDELGWPTRISAVPGAGYLNPGPTRHSTFAEQIAALPAGLRPGIMLIQGGRNDAGFPAPLLRSAVCSTVGLARARYTGAQVVIMGNVPVSVPVTAAQVRVERTLIAASRSCDVPLIDPIAEHWINAHNGPAMIGHVPGHPNDRGYQFIAQHVVADLRRLAADRPGTV